MIRTFSKIKFGNKKLILNNIYDLHDVKDKDEISTIILNIKDSYEDKWKSINKINTAIELPIRLSINAEDTKFSEKLEKNLSSIDLISEFRIEMFNNKEIIYKIIFNGNPNKLLDDLNLSKFKVDNSNKVWKIQ